MRDQVIRALGIDPAATTGYALLEGGRYVTGGSWLIASPGWTKTPEASYHAARELGRRILSKIAEQVDRPSVIVCEDPTSRSAGIAKAYGMLLCEVAEAGRAAHIPVVFVRPTSWKKRVLGSGRASKGDAMRYASGLADMHKDQDHADAACIARYAE